MFQAINMNKFVTNASSGSSLGSIPNSNPAIPAGGAPEPSSPTTTGELISASESKGPGGTVTRWDLKGWFKYKCVQRN